MNELPNLLTNRVDHARRAMPEQVTAPAREKIEIAIAFSVPNP